MTTQQLIWKAKQALESCMVELQHTDDIHVFAKDIDEFIKPFLSDHTSGLNIPKTLKLLIEDLLVEPEFNSCVIEKLSEAFDLYEKGEELKANLIVNQLPEIEIDGVITKDSNKRRKLL